MNEPLEVTGSVVSEIEELARRANSEAVLVEVEGSHYSVVELHDATPKLHGPSALALHTLKGLVGYLEVNRDQIDPADVVLHVSSESSVEVVSGIKGPRNQRFVYATALAKPTINPESLGWLPPDQMTIALNTLCTGDGDRAKVVELVGNVSAEQKAHLQDDGFTQEVTVRGGVTLVGEKEVPNPVGLAPYRTFREVDQPASPFLLRFQGGADRPIECKLFEADAGTWKLEAIKRVGSRRTPRTTSGSSAEAIDAGGRCGHLAGPITRTKPVRFRPLLLNPQDPRWRPRSSERRLPPTTACAFVRATCTTSPGRSGARSWGQIRLVGARNRTAHEPTGAARAGC